MKGKEKRRKREKPVSGEEAKTKRASMRRKTRKREEGFGVPPKKD